MFNKGDRVRFRHAHGEIVGEIVKITKKGFEVKDFNDGSIVTIPTFLVQLLKLESVQPPEEKSSQES